MVTLLPYHAVMVTLLPYHAVIVTLLPCAYIPIYIYIYIYIRNDRRTTYMHTLGLKQIII